MPGVHRASASIASNSVTVEFDETATSVAALTDQITACGYHCTGRIMPRHVCEPPVKEAESAGISCHPPEGGVEWRGAWNHPTERALCQYRATIN
jgi:hypothetical protein